ncbi:hypothetical protein BBROOKSOX_1194 [Bathymodiolus brooksi thiotrophic gill symbiont]|nr:hypothetical protein BBROOKSOX_1194 [Bathymodiolus brooksi thiotrophic gill symbiont]
MISASSELLLAIESFIFVNLADKSALLPITDPACISALFAIVKAASTFLF